MNIENPDLPRIERIRHELKRRALTVAAIDRISPAMIRITLTGEALSDFVSLGFDDHCKVIVPDETGEQVMRDYTPRAYDTERRELVIDFAVHEAGPATRWAMNAKLGDTLQIAGPRGSAVLRGNITHTVLVGDETALPAIGRYIETAGADADIHAIIAVPDIADEQQFVSEANVSVNWVHRPSEDAIDPAPLIAELERRTFGEGTYVWIAAEAGVARSIRKYLSDERGHPLYWMKAAGYWVRGEADSSQKTIED